MALLGTLSSVNLIAGAGILGNVGGVAIIANANLTTSIANYTSVAVVNQFATIATTGYVTIDIVANTFPALTNSVPSAYSGTFGLANTMTSQITQQSANILGNGDLGKFDQVFSSADGLVQQTNQLIKSAVNATDSNVVTGYTSQDNIITGGFSDLTQAFGAFAADLAQLGSLIDLENLNNLGSPAALLQQMASLGNLPPGLNTALLEAGVPQDVVENIDTTNFTLAVEKKCYEAMTKVTGTDLKQVLKLLRVTTSGITTMADLLNPVKIFPRSFITFTAPTSEGLRAVYIDDTGTVNSRLAQILPASVLAPLQGNPLQTRTDTV